MFDHVCDVCQEYLATHTVIVYSDDREQEHYLCDDHFDEMANPRRFLSMLDYPLETEENIFKEIFPD